MATKMSTKKMLILCVCVILLFLYVFYPAHKTSVDQESASVGQVGINQIKFPNLNTKYIQAVEWPPKITVSNQPFSCVTDNQNQSGSTTGSTTKQGAQMVEMNMGNNRYCITTESEGAAGSTYITYTYNFSPIQNNKTTYSLNFTLREVQCLNYDNPQQTECLNERQHFNVNTLVGSAIDGVTP
jgi:hypothetical protein